MAPEILSDNGLQEGDSCPLCGKHLVLRHSNRGDFLGCSDYPNCSFMQPVAVKHSVVSIVPIDATCPKCGGQLEVKRGRFGMFIGCSNYPTCDYSYNTTAQSEISCPICHKGKIVSRSTSSGRVFYACSSFPDCKFSVPGKPVETTCETCSFPLMYEKKTKKGIVLMCGNVLCESRRKRNKKIVREC